MNNYNITLNQSITGNFITSIQANVSNIGTLVKSDFNSTNICLLAIESGNSFGVLSILLAREIQPLHRGLHPS